MKCRILIPKSYGPLCMFLEYILIYTFRYSTLEKGNEEVKLTSYVHNRPPYYLINIYIPGNFSFRQKIVKTGAPKKRETQHGSFSFVWQSQS